MIRFLAKRLIADYDNPSSPKVRQAYGILCGAVGICFNLLLFAGKFFAGLISNSIAITADAFNNLSDAGSSVITLIGFHMAGQKPDLQHPFGHGRIEYVSGLVVAGAILIMAFELIKTSLEKIILLIKFYIVGWVFYRRFAFIFYAFIFVKRFICPAITGLPVKKSTLPP